MTLSIQVTEAYRHRPLGGSARSTIRAASGSPFESLSVLLDRYGVAPRADAYDFTIGLAHRTIPVRDNNEDAGESSPDTCCRAPFN
jgi:hypothetical protein